MAKYVKTCVDNKLTLKQMWLVKLEESYLENTIWATEPEVCVLSVATIKFSS
jgi:hypothetical protein